MNSEMQLEIFRSLFKGREDVFAIRWEKSGKSGYMPAYYYDPYHYRVHKMNGGTFQNYPHKSFQALNENEIQKHLNGKQQIGIYPILTDNTSWFLVADFDKQNWQVEATSFLNACILNRIPAYLERSRSGNGGHVWIFFDKPYPAVKSRIIFISILQQSGAFSFLDKGSSFDRLFPNQDFLSGKGLGNLIALPFFKPAMEKGNSSFIDPKSFIPYDDQWQFLKEIEKCPAQILENLLEHPLNNKTDQFIQNDNSKLAITLQNQIKIQKSGLTNQIIDFLKDELNFTNAEYFVKKNSGKNTFGTESYFKLYKETEFTILAPRGFIGKLLRFCKEQKLKFVFKDQRTLRKEVVYSFNANLRTHQNEVLKVVLKKDFGVIVAPPGSGKTIIALRIIAEKKQPALILVHRKQLLEQWIERVQSFVNIPRHEIGIIGQGKVKIGNVITVATIQSLSKCIEQIQNSFGIIVIDECHHIPAVTFHETIEKLNTFYLYGLTATPFRKYSDGKLIFAYLGDVIHEISSNEVENFKHAQVIVRNTNFNVPFNSKTDKYETLSKILVHDTDRNHIILKDIKNELSRGNKIAIITERKEHIETLNLFLKNLCEVIILNGDDSDTSRKAKWKSLNQGDFQVLITTGQYFGEGSDLSNINILFLVYPFSFKGKLIQYIGRVQRSEINPTIYDYRDEKVDYLNKQFLKRNAYYRKLAKQASLFEEPTENIPENQTLVIDKKIKVALDDLDFRYGNVGFSYLDKVSSASIDFEIENHEFRPEFEVLKSYFSKILKLKLFNIDIYAEIENGLIISQLATSTDLDKINKEIVETVKFHFFGKNIIGRIPTGNKNILSADEILKSQNIYQNEKEILNDILKNSKYIHSRNIQFLANIHEGKIMKLRFVLQPFSIVFLVSGKQNYHIVLETLDTEEATYIWHIDRNKAELKAKIEQIDKELNIIRNKGRQVYLDSHPENFSKITHFYTDEKKGFILWKGQIEERLI